MSFFSVCLFTLHCVHIALGEEFPICQKSSLRNRSLSEFGGLLMGCLWGLWGGCGLGVGLSASLLHFCRKTNI